jgi:predicted RNase H-like HicB family nuclease
LHGAKYSWKATQVEPNQWPGCAWALLASLWPLTSSVVSLRFQDKPRSRGSLAKGGAGQYPRSMKLTAVFEPAKEGGYTCFVEEVPAAISQGETLVEAKANLLDALKLVLECQRDLAEKDLSPNAVREPIEFAEA